MGISCVLIILTRRFMTTLVPILKDGFTHLLISQSLLSGKKHTPVKYMLLFYTYRQRLIKIRLAVTGDMGAMAAYES